jgi:hypothetical protein
MKVKKTSNSMSNDDQSRRFIEAAREAECSEDEAVFDETLKRIAKVKPVRPTKPPAKGER